VIATDPSTSVPMRSGDEDFSQTVQVSKSPLSAQGRYAEALEGFRRGHDLGSKQLGWSYPSAQWVQGCELLVELDAKLPSILKGEAVAKDAGGRIVLADLCTKKGLHASSARFYGEAFTTDPTLAETPKTVHRYNAACAAARAGVGEGKDEPKPDDAACAKLREKAQAWLRADLTVWVKLLDGGPPQAPPFITRTLAHWKVDTDLAGIRDVETLAKLPESEREPLRSLWADVEALRKKAEAKGTPAGTK
jgi:hypothetical protein